MKALAIASGVVFWTLVLSVTVLLFLPGSDEGEPVATVAIQPAQPGSALAPAAAPAVTLPPGFSVMPRATQQPNAPMLAPPGQGTTMVPVAPGQLRMPTPGPGGSLQQGPDGAPATEAHAANEDAAPVMPPAIVDATGKITLAAVPASGLVEESKYGPLPKIAADGRRPAEVYARPLNQAQASGGPCCGAGPWARGSGRPPDGDVIKGLPPPVSVAYGAYGRGLQERVTKARADGHEVLLAIPLEPMTIRLKTLALTLSSPLSQQTKTSSGFTG